MYHALPPLYAAHPRILILGTFPSPLSREKGEYYGNQKNQFWRIIFDTFNLSFDNPSYNDKKELLLQNRIALWDVIASCEIEGALDSAIRSPIYNIELPVFIETNKISAIMFNGKNAYNFYKREIGNIDGIILPSTSPANTRLSYAEKLRFWAEALASC